jgi:ABC-type Fe3+-siderophore transport system permease subunit
MDMELSITTPALLFPAISLLMLAYTNRFLALASLIRNLHDKYKKDPNQKHIVEQIRNLRTRIRLIRSMQALGVLSFLFCVACMYCIFRNWNEASYVIFAISIVAFMASLLISLFEISLSTKALELELSDLEKETKSNFFTDFLGVRDNRDLHQ